MLISHDRTRPLSRPNIIDAIDTRRCLRLAAYVPYVLLISICYMGIRTNRRAAHRMWDAMIAPLIQSPERALSCTLLPVQE